MATAVKRAQRAPKAVTAPTASFDVPAGGQYAPGATATLTVVRPASVPLSAVVSVFGFTDIPVNGAVGPLPKPTVTAKDGRTYTFVSDDGVTTKITTTA